MDEVFRILKDNRVGGFATVDEKGNPQVRAFQVMLIENDMVYFCTGAGKKVYKQMQANPNVAFCVTSPDYVSVRLNGRVRFFEDKGLKERILDENPGVKAIYKSADNPALATFYLESGTAEVFDLSGLPPRREFFRF